MRLEMLTYDELLTEMESAVEWLSKLGITKPNRIKQHHANIRRLADAEKAGTLDQIRNAIEPEKAREILWSWVESFEFVDISKSLKEIDPSELLPVLKRAVEGPPDVSAEAARNSSNAARNLMFELVIAARLARAGLKPHLQEPDVLVDIDDWLLLIACKRPLGDAAIPENVLRAAAQLRKALNAHPKRQKIMGVIAVSVSRILNPGDKILEVPAREALSPALSEHVGQIWERHKKLFLTVSDPRIAGALISLSSPATIVNERRFLAVGTTHVYSFRGPAEARDLLRHLEELMRASAIQELRKHEQSI